MQSQYSEKTNYISNTRPCIFFYSNHFREENIFIIPSMSSDFPQNIHLIFDFMSSGQALMGLI